MAVVLAEKNETNGQLWAQACQALSSHLPGLFFEHFIKPLDHDFDSETGNLYLIASDEKRIAHIEMKYGRLIRESLAPILPSGFNVQIISQKELGFRNPGNSSPSSAKATDDLESPLSAHELPHARKDTSENSFICDSNQESRIQKMLDLSWKGILYIYGPSGTGKSHLARAIASGCRSQSFSMEEFMVGFATASREGTLLEWKKDLHSQELVVLDDLQFLRQKAVRTREQLRALMDAALQGKIRLILVADQSAGQIDGGADLRSRLLEARPVELGYLDSELRKTLLLQMARRCDVDLPEAYSSFLAERIQGDHRKLQNAIHRLSMMSVIPADPRWTETEFQDLMESGSSAEPDKVLQVVCRFYNVHPDLLKSSARDQSVVRARHLSAYFLYHLAGMKLGAIAGILGRKDHSAVLYGIRRTESLFSQDLFLKKQAASLEAEIRKF
ncbi:MAG TPA: hypothetical protein DEA96_09310 [Leptospiraceae bacterium]|nr:hypothetical protein [Spirochaetaceae bacterium]HBS05151.1 hypothetical protein [Leptospiraceae bacterium]|tara:strand:- start:30395 stop:31729 length:1335 start_codon:yes stop_codon:yes gene_type:complete